MWPSLAPELGWTPIRFGMWMRKSHHRSEAGFGVGFVCFFLVQFGTAVPLWGKHVFLCHRLSLFAHSLEVDFVGVWKVHDDCPGLLVHVLGIFISSRFKFLARLDHSTRNPARVQGSRSFVEVSKLSLVVQVFVLFVLSPPSTCILQSAVLAG